MREEISDSTNCIYQRLTLGRYLLKLELSLGPYLSQHNIIYFDIYTIHIA